MLQAAARRRHDGGVEYLLHESEDKAEASTSAPYDTPEGGNKDGINPSPTRRPRQPEAPRLEVTGNHPVRDRGYVGDLFVFAR